MKVYIVQTGTADTPWPPTVSDPTLPYVFENLDALIKGMSGLYEWGTLRWRRRSDNCWEAKRADESKLFAVRVNLLTVDSPLLPVFGEEASAVMGDA